MILLVLLAPILAKMDGTVGEIGRSVMEITNQSSTGNPADETPSPAAADPSTSEPSAGGSSGSSQATPVTAETSAAPLGVKGKIST